MTARRAVLPALVLALATQLLAAAALAGPYELDDVRILREDPVDRDPAPEPKSAGEFSDRGAFHLSKGRPREALSDYDRALGLDGTLFSALVGRANALSLLLRHEEAIRAYDRALAAAPDSDRALHGRGTSRLETGDLKGAAEDYGRAIEADGAGKISSLVMRGYTRVRLGQPELARRDFSEAIRLSPDFLEAYSARGDLSLSSGDVPAAIADFTVIVEKAPDRPEGLLLRGTARAEAGNADGALSDIDRALALAPKDPDVRFNRGRVFTRLGRSEDALREFGEALRLKPDRPEIVYLERARTKAAAGDVRGAIADYTLALDIDDDLPEARFGRGRLRRITGDFEGSAEDLTRSVELWPENAESAFFLGDALLALGDAARAEKAFDRAQALIPKSPAVLVYRALCRVELGRDREALSDLDAALRLDPENAAVLLHRGRVRARVGLLSGAREDLGGVTERLPKSPDGWAARGILNFDTGRWKEALRDLAEAVRVDDNFLSQEYRQLRLWILRTGGGDRESADRELTAFLKARGTEGLDPFYLKLAGHLLGRTTEEELFAATESEDPETSRGRRCEACFFAGSRRRAVGDAGGAFLLFTRAAAEGELGFTEHWSALAGIRSLMLGAWFEEAAGGLGVYSVETGGPAAKAGLREGDLVVGLMGKSPSNERIDEVLGTQVGALVLEVDRGEDAMVQITVPLAR